MKKILLITLLHASLSGVCWSDQLPEEVFKNLSEVIREHCPEAVIETGNGAFTAKHGTMMFTLHGRSKNGEVSRRTYQKEGPNHEGFLLTVTLEKDGYHGPLKIPLESSGPYFPTCFNVTGAQNGKGYYWIRYSYGVSFDQKLKQAIFDALPGNTRPIRFVEVPSEPSVGGD